MYAPVAPGPAPKFMVIPKLVEIAAKSLALTFLRTKAEGKMTNTAVVTTRKMTAIFFGLIAIAQINKNKNADKTNLGWTNDESDNSPAAVIARHVTMRWSLFRNSLMNSPIAMMKIDAEIDS